MKFRYAVPLFAAAVIAGTILVNIFTAPPAYGQHLMGGADFNAVITCSTLDIVTRIADAGEVDQAKGLRIMGLAFQSRLCERHRPTDYIAVAIHREVFIDAPGAGKGIIVEAVDNDHITRFLFLFEAQARKVRALFSMGLDA